MDASGDAVPSPVQAMCRNATAAAFVWYARVVVFLYAVVAILGAAFVAVCFAPRRLRLLLWVLVILVCVVPWLSFQDHPHWTRVNWVAFSQPFRRRDILLNIALYVPIGLFWTRGASSRLRDVLTCSIAAAILSVATETTQIYSHSRFPSMTDLVTNTLGATLGALVMFVRHRSARETIDITQRAPSSG
jgi:glycopeptide antibiotics resistance protein